MVIVGGEGGKWKGGDLEVVGWLGGDVWCRRAELVDKMTLNKVREGMDVALGSHIFRHLLD